MTTLEKLDGEIRRILAEKLYEILYNSKYTDEEKKKMMEKVKELITKGDNAH